MKKIYVTPATIRVEIKTQSLLVQYSQTKAASDASVFSREGDSSFFDDDED